MNQIDIATNECVDALLDMVEERAGTADDLQSDFEDIVGMALERYGLWVMRRELERANKVLSVLESNVKHLEVAPRWTTGKCGDKWLVYYDNLAVTLGESDPPKYRTFDYASQAVEWIQEEGSIKYPSNTTQVQNEPDCWDDANDHQITERCQCKFCHCLNEVFDGGVCDSCASGGHQG